MRFSPAAILAFGLITSACGSSPVGPTGPTGPLNFNGDGAPGPFPPGSRVIIGGQTCRVYPTLATVVETTAGVSSTTTRSCSYNGATQVSCTSQSTDATGAMITTTGTADFASVADIVDEVQVVPPLTKSLVITSNQGSAYAVTITNSYDGQGRLASFTAAAAEGSVTTTYTAWDPAGRPTSGTVASPSPIPLSVTIAYDDVARTSTMTTGIFGFVTTSVSTYDPDGNLVSIVVTGPGGSTSSTTTNVSTATICK